MNLSRQIVQLIESIVGQCAPKGVEVNLTIAKPNEYLRLPDRITSWSRYFLSLTKTLIQEVEAPFDIGARRDLERLAAAFATGANELARKMLAEIDSDAHFYNSQQERAARARTQAEQHLDDEIAALELLL